MFNSEMIAAGLTWLVYSIYCFGLIPQMFLNYKLRSASGLSDLTLLGYFAGYVTQFYYVFFEDFPLSYKVMIPIGIVMVSILVWQRFHYNPNTVTSLLRYSYLFIFCFVFIFTPIFLRGRLDVDEIFGWISAFIWFVYALPQVIKIYREKSFHGISFGFLSVMAIGVSLELTSALILGLPIQTIISNVRALLIYAIFCVQFFRYKIGSVKV
ncbi:PQ-loop repeat-containing protein [Candidatus Babeliales bacterium]|nr:PQ-loop repeat-containing protein [Candidatus Babeliales bacterium]